MDLAEISTWRRRWLADGVILDGDKCRVRIRTDQRPLRPFKQILGDEPVGELQRFVTVEGEHAGMIGVNGGVVAIVVGDDSYVRIEGRSTDRARDEWLRDLVHTLARFYPFGLGQLRRRRYMYRPPEGWQPIVRAGCVVWLAPDYPRVSGRITVFEARPLKWYAPGAVDRYLFVDENPFVVPDTTLPPIPVQVAVAGIATRAIGRMQDGTSFTVMKALLQDERYLYATQLDARTSEWESFVPAFDDVLVTIERVPTNELPPSSQHFIHWIE